MEAVRHGDVAAVTRALQTDPEPDAPGLYPMTTSATALMQASLAGQVDIVELLLSRGASTALETRAEEAPTPPGWTALCFATLGDHAEISAHLVAAGAAHRPPCMVEAELMGAARRKDSASVARLLATTKPSAEGLRFALYEAIVAHDVRSVKRLLDHGVDGLHARAAFHHADPITLAGDDLPVVVALAQHGLDAQALFNVIVVKLRHGTAAEVAEAIEAGVRARVDFAPPGSESLLLTAIELGADDAVRLLLAHGESPDQRLSNGRPVLLTAVRYPQMVKHFIAAKVHVDATDSEGKTALGQAVVACQPVSVARLLAAGADWRAVPGGGANLYLVPLRHRHCPDELRLAMLRRLREAKVPFGPKAGVAEQSEARRLLTRLPAAFARLLEQAGLPRASPGDPPTP